MPFLPQLRTLLDVQAWGLPAVRTLKARVVRTTLVEFLYFCGCELIGPLSEQELQTWITQAKDWTSDR